MKGGLLGFKGWVLIHGYNMCTSKNVRNYSNTESISECNMCIIVTEKNLGTIVESELIKKYKT